MRITPKALISTLALSSTSLLFTASQSFAATVSVEITNLTHGSYFTPLLVAAHSNTTHLFEVGTIATDGIQEMAEGGSIATLSTEATNAGSVTSENPAGGLLAPAQNTSITDFDTLANTHLSIAAMVLPSNDGFVGLDAWEIPTTTGTYTIFLNAYDAGTEANNELVAEGSGEAGILGIPANPGANGGSNGTGVTTTETNNNVHIHRGVLGDTDLEGGASDLDSRIHRWLNPVAKVVVTVQ